MAWDTTDLASYNDIIIQDGVFSYNFLASGAIYKGQAVTPCPTRDGYVMTCSTPAHQSDSIGIANYTVANGDAISIAGPGNVVYAVCDTSSDISAGIPVYGDEYGILDATAGNAVKIAAYALNTPTVVTTHYVGKFLVV